MFALHLDKLLEGTGVRSFAVHPGSFIKTEIFNKMKLSLFKLFITWFVLPFKGMCVEDSGISGLYCATSPEVLGLDSGYFFGPDEKNNGFTDKRQVGTWNDGVTDKNSQILWNKTKELVGD
ncbi:hypothetical protein NDN08_002193 [Rhodosorus marinus]|uniref:Protochlorophyllide reductase n=1 Tax=Rhodosorus marinus TaxID=101924 RepID=A0AAV8UT49_9RHOD|nr:hypothetical protein NDN08_002193 [Rhodosorus marinus]